MKVRIYKPAKSVMQSGRAKTASWVLEYETATSRRPEPLMGWVSSGDTLNQVKLNFGTMEEAVAFARKQGWEFTLNPAHRRKIRPRNYSDNFRYIPPVDKV